MMRLTMSAGFCGALAVLAACDRRDRADDRRAVTSQSADTPATSSHESRDAPLREVSARRTQARPSAPARESQTERRDAGARSGPISQRELFGDPDAMVEGTNVDLEDVVIGAKSGNMLRVRHRGRDLFVKPIDPSTLELLTVGATVDIQGTLRKAPSAKQARLVFAMSRREAARLARHRVYVDAWFVSARH